MNDKAIWLVLNEAAHFYQNYFLFHYLDFEEIKQMIAKYLQTITENVTVSHP